MFKLSAKEFSQKYYCDYKYQARSNRYFSLDCQSGEGLTNLLLPELKKNSPDEFEYHLNFILKKCINVNRSFSDAVEFLSIWLEKSPKTLLSMLQKNELKQFFNRTEYEHEGDQWYFPRLLHAFTALVEKKSVTANEILDYLFETFDFFNMPEVFVIEIIGYDRLDRCIEESPKIFKQALLSKIYEFVEQNKTIDIGSHSRKYLKAEIQTIDDIKRIKAEPDKQIESKALIAYIKSGGFFIYPSIKNFKQSDPYIVPLRYINFRGGN